MALIRHAEADRIARDAIVLDLGDVRAQAELIMSQAKAQASKTILAARAEREHILAGAREEGYRAGFEKGHAEGLVRGTEDGNAAALVERKGELSRLDSAWSAALSSFCSSRDAMLDDARDALVMLACRIASRVTRRTVEADPTVVVDQVREAASMLTGASRLVVEVGPASEAIVREALPGVMASLSSSAHAEIRVNESLTDGSCVVRSALGEIDASIETQLDRVAEALVPEVRSRPSDASP